MDLDREDLAELAETAAVLNSADLSALRTLCLEFCETLHDFVALQEENAALRRALREPPRVPHHIAGWGCLKEGAAITGHHVETLRLWCVKGRIDAFRTGGRWMIRLRSAIAFARTQKGGQPVQ